MVYTDGRYLVATTVWELRLFAQKICLGSHWFSYKPYARYELQPHWIHIVLKHGAEQITPKMLLHLVEVGDIEKI